MKFILSIVMALALIVPTMAASDLSSTAPSLTQTSSLYNAKEFSLNLGTSYNLDTSAAFQQEYAFNLAVGSTYFFTRNIGVEAWLPFYSTKGASFQEVQAGVLFRLPLSTDKAILKNIAPYIGVGGVYNWDTDSTWAYIAKVGSEFRLNKKWSTFIEGQYRNDEFQNWGQGQVNLVGGFKLIF